MSQERGSGHSALPEREEEIPDRTEWLMEDPKVCMKTCQGSGSPGAMHSQKKLTMVWTQSWDATQHSCWQLAFWVDPVNFLLKCKYQHGKKTTESTMFRLLCRITLYTKSQKRCDHFKKGRRSTDANPKMAQLERLGQDLKAAIVTILNEAKGNMFTGNQNTGNV